MKCARTELDDSLAEDAAQAVQDQLNDHAPNQIGPQLDDHDEACEDDNIDDVLAARFRSSNGFCLEFPDLDPFADDDPMIDTNRHHDDDWIPDRAPPSSTVGNRTTAAIRP